MSDLLDGSAVRTRLERELGRVDEPPLGGLVEASLRTGRRGRRLRTVARVGGAGSAVAAVVLAVAAGPGLLQGANGPSAANGPSVEAAPAAPATRAAPTQEAPVTVEEAKARLEQEIGSALAGIGITAPATFEFFPDEDVANGSPVVRVVVDAGRGPGMFQLSPASRAGVDDVTVDRNEGNCIQSLTVLAQSRTRGGLQLDVATCLTWNGTENPRSPAPLTRDQAVTLATGAALQKAVARAGAAMTAAARG